MEGAIRAIGRTPRQRTTLYGQPPAERVAASFGAPPLSQPVNPPASERGLKPLPLLERPGLAASA
jgi:FO synthase